MDTNNISTSSTTPSSTREASPRFAFAPVSFVETFEGADEEAVAFAPQLVHGGSLEDDSLEEDETMLTPSPPSYRHAVGIFTTQRLQNDLSFNAFSDASFFEPTTQPLPLFVLDKKPLLSTTNVTSPLSPSSYLQSVDVPQKMASVFDAVHPAFTSQAAPTKIMDVVKSSLASLRCEWDMITPWSLQVSALIVAEELRFMVNLTQIETSKYELEFVLLLGDQTRFYDLQECIRARCSDIDDDACLAMLSTELDAWMDDEKEVTGRRYVLKEKDAEELLLDLACDQLDVDTLYEVAKTVKNHCRHRRNRQLLLQVNRKDLLQGLKWMLADNAELTRYGLFILQQFAKDQDLCSKMFTTPFERSAFALLLDQVVERDSDNELSEKPRFGKRSLTGMAESVRQTALFA